MTSERGRGSFHQQGSPAEEEVSSTHPVRRHMTNAHTSPAQCLPGPSSMLPPSIPCRAHRESHCTARLHVSTL